MSLGCFLPPHVLKGLANNHPEESVRKAAVLSLLSHMPENRKTNLPAAIKSVKFKNSERFVYDCLQSEDHFIGPVRSEGDPPSEDEAVDEAYDYTGNVLEFYKTILKRKSIDGNGMAVDLFVHYGKNWMNAAWDGERMIFGDGDGKIFLRFTKALDVIGHELTHGVVQYGPNLMYFGESGAINEHLADVMGVVLEQRHKRHSPKEASWRVGEELLGPAIQAKSIRIFKDEPAYENDPILGTDPQPKHISKIYLGPSDNGGVHINSGIVNNAFYRYCMKLGKNSWDGPIQIWYKTLKSLHMISGFYELASVTEFHVKKSHGSGSRERKLLRQSWKEVGIHLW